MTKEQMVISILSIVFTGLASSIITNIIINRRQNRMIKIDLVRTVVRNIYMITDSYSGDRNEFCKLLNEAYITFNESPKVIERLNDFKLSRIDASSKTQSNSDSANARLTRLIKAMCDDAKIDYKSFDDTFWEKPFVVK